MLPTAAVAVPVSFGWHPYLRLPDVPRSEWRVEMPVRRRALLDERGLPTGETEPVELEPGPLGERTYDDLFVGLDSPTAFVLEGGGRRIELAMRQNYAFAQVYAPLEGGAGALHLLRADDGSGERAGERREPELRAPGRELPGRVQRARPSGGLTRSGGHLEQEVIRLAVLLDELDAPRDRHEQALGVHVAGVHVG